MDIPTLTSDPIKWSTIELASYLKTTDCKDFWPWLLSQSVDGRSFMLLPPAPELHTRMGFPWDAAVKIARHVAGVRLAYMKQYYANTS